MIIAMFSFGGLALVTAAALHVRDKLAELEMRNAGPRGRIDAKYVGR